MKTRLRIVERRVVTEIYGAKEKSWIVKFFFFFFKFLKLEIDESGARIEWGSKSLEVADVRGLARRDDGRVAWMEKLVRIAELVRVTKLEEVVTKQTSTKNEKLVRENRSQRGAIQGCVFFLSKISLKSDKKNFIRNIWQNILAC